ncbi:retron St85 family RNA-directed DNA polymerase [Pelagibius sp.]|uniref:retron St85 family RNA-directed DNA polymerase n=1 Tax=Pelagibius sp. TaxID=1931238 RepID=UPI002617F673|nr:retron St85 family RNA-directed DNA polymerase [Pelagibius sp.]
MLRKRLAKQSGVEEGRLELIEKTASKRYKVYEIPKMSGGIRVIEHPSRELKAIQRWIVKTILRHLPIHDCATAYKEGASIKYNAERHRRTNFTTRFDFLGFFPSFRQERIELFLEQQSADFDLGLSDGDISFIGNILCRHGRLTIGAPSSPAVTNVMMYSFDRQFAALCSERKLVYTRYADDLFVSSREPNSLGGLEDEIRRVNRGIDHLALRINHRKTAFLSRKYARRIAGVIVTPDRRLSIGRDRKREIKSLVYMYLNGRLPSERLSYLRGLLAFACDVEPDFESRLRRKYGDSVIQQVLHSPNLDSLSSMRRS